MNGYKYAADKPEDCRTCFFYDHNRSKCRLGKMNCYYLIAVDENEEFPCDTCSYHRAEAPCIGFCMKKIVTEWRERRKPAYAVTAKKEPEEDDAYEFEEDEGTAGEEESFDDEDDGVVDDLEFLDRPEDEE